MTHPGPPTQLFFSTPAQRAALARERFFEEGEQPTGLVNEAVLQSWSRCNAAGKRTRDRIEAEPLSALRTDAALRHSRLLRAAASPALAQLEQALAGTPSQLLLTNAQGVIVCTGQRTPCAAESALPALARLGMDLSEASLGTTAPGIVSATGKGCSVLANEHFNEAILGIQCAAAPIRGVDGQLAGVLDLSVEGRGFGFDAYALIASYARGIENRLLQLQSDDLLVLAFHADPALLGTPLEALAGIDGGGMVRWTNATAARLTGAQRGLPALEVFGQPLHALVALARHPGPHALCLPNGLTAWCGARLQARDGAGALTPVAATCTTPPAEEPPARSAAPRTLEEAQADSIAQALQAAGGKVARAARALGVSRGVIYRHLQRKS
ncbi:transcriptional regulator of acetoin/glycerol metabolism [Acidovorax soli]|uniref:Transcriptional regulator of acetoin/glycerol metabolism n=1 Tax=Acidovorax soli TaxID=592050 RepID=A0A7X0PE32_9BURK|nr:helix-turn-helix domain-containing protein [Acidovorax soli]MBB6559836.1 transcriptional regulator of acetoin/glycerol metabolism [Acidovorax soli]